ncbi:MAG: CAP domain-containing protein [Actinomycetota bacterium]
MALALGPAVIVAAPPAQAATAPSAAVTAQYEARVIYLMNRQRLSHGIHSLTPAACPDQWAEVWASYLGSTGRFYHRSMSAYLRGCGSSRVAENLARGNVSADRLVAAWMASPGHRANILDRQLTTIGVGAVYAHGTWTLVADFARP